MGGLNSKISKSEADSVDHDFYYKAEFKAMDTNNTGKLSKADFTKLLMFLGFGGETNQTEALLHTMNKTDDDSTIDLEEYISVFKNHSDVQEKTCRMRVIFGNFNDNKHTPVPKSEVEKRLRIMKFDMDEKRKKCIDDMDADKDGKITYEEFLKGHLQNKGYIS